MKKVRRLWVKSISKLIWLAEQSFFYPKLKMTYKEIKFSGINESLVIFDVGANKGQSITFFRDIYPSANIYAFEPSNNVFEILKSNINDDNTHLFQIGMGSIAETKIFYEAILDETSTFILPNLNSSYIKKKSRILLHRPETLFELRQSEVTSIDLFVAEKFIKFIDILKIDVEGFELEVLIGATHALSHGKIHVIQLERHSNDMREDIYPAINELLTKYGYSRTKEIKHPFGDFFEVLYQKSMVSG